MKTKKQKKELGDFPLKPMLVKLPECDCNYCRLSRYCEELGDEAPRLAYLVATQKMLEHFIEILKREGWTKKGLNSVEEKNLSFYLTDLDDTNALIGDILQRKATKLVLKDPKGEEIK